MKRLTLRIIYVGLVLAGLIAWADLQPTPSVGAQSPATRVLITGVDASKFPEVSVWVSVSDAAGSRVSKLAANDFVLREDGVEVRPSVSDAEAGLQVVFLMDTAYNVQKKGKSGKPYLEEMRDAIKSFAADPWMHEPPAPVVDRVTVLAALNQKGRTRVTDVQVVVDDKVFHNDVKNGLDLYRRPDQGVTNLYEMLLKGLERFPQSTQVPAPNRMLVVFSDGIDLTTFYQIDDVATRAKRLNVPIYAVQLNQNPEGISHMQALARESLGSYYTSPQNLDDLWKQLAGQHTQYKLTYTSTRSSSDYRKVSVQIGSAEDRCDLVVDLCRFQVQLQPPSVSIVSPEPDALITRKTDKPEPGPNDFDLRYQPVQVEFSWPDNHQRPLREARLIVNGITVSSTAQISGTAVAFSWDMSTFKDGLNTLQVEAEDALDPPLIGQSGPVTIRLNSIIPTPIPTPPPTPTPRPCPGNFVQALPCQLGQFVEQGTRGEFLPRVTLVTLALSLATLALAIYIYFRRPTVVQVVQAAATSIRAKAKELTVPFYLDRSRVRGERQGKAFLTVLAGSDDKGPFELISENTRLGRDDSLVQVVFNDLSVSRLHARISEEQDGMFRIYDEGSMSGTYVNYEPIPMTGQWLQHNDIINLGRVQLQFQLRNVPVESSVTVKDESHPPSTSYDGATPLDDQRTEPFTPQVPETPTGVAPSADDEARTQRQDPASATYPAGTAFGSSP